MPLAGDPGFPATPVICMTLPAVSVSMPLNNEGPLTPSRETGDEEPIPTFPFAKTVSNCAPLEEATTNGFSVPLPWMLNDTVDDVAFTPATAPLSSNVPVPKVFWSVHRVI
jgi:hypothetical protein